MSYKYDFCPLPFSEMEISPNGNVYLCCPSWNNYYSIGNIFDHSYDEVWNSNNAVTLRQKILNNDYSLCKKDKCFLLHNKNFVSEFEIETPPQTGHLEKLPFVVKFGYDYECNIACIFCRNKIKRLSDDELKILDDKIDSFFIPLLKTAKVLVINTHGDPFGSRHSIKLIKKAIETYPDLKFDFTTNGLLCNETMFKRLNITPEKIDKIRVSIHATTAKTYGKIINHGELMFDKLMDNMKYLSELKKECHFTFLMQFVVTSLNYKEIPAFVDMADKYNAHPVFWEYKSDSIGHTDYIEDLSITNPKHKYHNELVKVLKHPNMYKYNDILYPILLDIQNKPVETLLDKLLKKFKGNK